MKTMTEQQALQKLTFICAQSEHCTHEMKEKMAKWQLPEEAQTRCLKYLVKEKYVDDERYARFFINDKMKYNRWGRRKIEQALWLKGIGRDIATPLLDEVEDEAYQEILLPMMKAKWKTIKGRDEYERKMKLTRWALGRGYAYPVIKRCAERMELDMEDCDAEDE